MPDFETFKSQDEAIQRASKFMGWTVKVEQYQLPDDENADEDGNVWIICCDDDKYLRDDGYVR